MPEVSTLKEFEVKADLFHGQFFLGKSPSLKLEKWRHETLGEWHLFINQPLRSLRIVSRDGRHLGWLVGHIIDATGEHLANHGDVMFPGQGDCALVDPEDWVFGFGGRFACLWLTGALPRVYIDPLSTLSVAYSKDREELASTPTLLNWINNNLDIDLHQALHYHPANGYFPAGLTYDSSIRRILPNHYLSLKNFTLTRHWPPDDFTMLARREIKVAVHRTADRMRQIIEAVARTHPLCLATTGGRDSRLALAAGRNVLSSGTCFTLTNKRGVTGPGDLQFSKMFCQKFNLRQVTAPIGQASDRQRLEYAIRIGYGGATGKVNFFDLPLRGLVDLHGAFITAHSGSAAKAYFAQRLSSPDEATSAESMMGLLGIKNKLQYHEAFLEWHSRLPEIPASLKLDLLFIEHRDAGWTGVHMYGGAPFDVRIIPFSDRLIYGTQMRLPLSYRLRYLYFRDFVKYAWPEISRLPYVVAPARKGPLHWRVKKILKRYLADLLPD